MDFSGQREFAVRLGLEIAKKPGNLFVGGLSVWTALALLLPGARGDTREQLAAVLRLPTEQSDDEWIKAVDELIQGLTSTPPTRENEGRRAGPRWPSRKRAAAQLRLANALWLQKGLRLDAGYVSKVVKGLHAKAEKLDFARKPDAACDTINRWAAGNTLGKIQEVVSGSDIHPLTRLLLSNATYFKDDWSIPFESRMTKRGPFRRLNGTKVRVPMMRREDEFIYHSDRNLQVIDLPYSRQGLSMVVVLPENLREFEAGLTPQSLQELLQSLRYQHLVHLELPRWEFRKNMGIEDQLGPIGLKGLFTSEADLSGISSDEDLYINQVKHVTYVQADEQGTEATAVTVVHTCAVSVLHPPPPPKPIEMIVDRPFWFFIRDRESGSLLFSGRVEDPSKKE